MHPEHDIVSSHTIGKDASLAERAKGALAALIIWFGLLFGGTMLPVVSAWCAVCGRPLPALATALVALLSVVLPMPEVAAVSRFFLRTASFLRGGATVHFTRKVVRAAPLDESTVFAFHPHGVLPWGFALNGAVRAKARSPEYQAPEVHFGPRVTGIMAPVLFYIPLFGAFLRALGCCEPANKRVVTAIMKRRETFGIIPGGAEEVAIHGARADHLYLSRRKGFIKLALRHGYGGSQGAFGALLAALGGVSSPPRLPGTMSSWRTPLARETCIHVRLGPGSRRSSWPLSAARGQLSPSSGAAHCAQSSPGHGERSTPFSVTSSACPGSTAQRTRTWISGTPSTCAPSRPCTRPTGSNLGATGPCTSIESPFPPFSPMVVVSPPPEWAYFPCMCLAVEGLGLRQVGPPAPGDAAQDVYSPHCQRGAPRRRAGAVPLDDSSPPGRWSVGGVPKERRAPRVDCTLGQLCGPSTLPTGPRYEFKRISIGRAG